MMKWREHWIVFLCGLPCIGIADNIRIVTEHLPPYQINTAQGPRGFATEIVQQLFKEANLPYQIEFESWSRAYQLALRDPNVCIYSISKSAERERLFQWVGALSYNITGIYSLRSRTDIQLKSLQDAHHYRIAVTRDDITHHYLLEHGFREGKELYVLETVDSMLQVLVNRPKEIDLVLVNDTILKYRAHDAGLDEQQFMRLLDLTDLPLDFHLACSLKTSQALVAKLQDALMTLKRDGRYQKIVGEWSEQFKNKISVP